jgi:uncharacterized membrane protein YphA (DoxX/SURF4 family)
MNTWTRIGLVLLRLVIGWHFLFEGLDKLDSWYHGPREGSSEWSAEGYLRESQGPLSDWFRGQTGDQDDAALKQLTPDEPGKLPAATEAKWQKEFDAFAAHYELGNHVAVQPEHVGALALTPLAPFGVPGPALVRAVQKDAGPKKLQLTLAQQDLAAARERTVKWLTEGKREVPSKIPGVTEKVVETTPVRLALYRSKLDQLRDIETKGMPAFDRDVWKDNYRALKKDITTLRTDLLADLNKPLKDTLSVAKTRLNAEQLKRGPVPVSPPATTDLDRINFVTRWGVTIVGACLLLGLFTRLSCLAGAGFLLMFFLAMPSLPWVPLNPRAEGHYLFVNKNIIEMVALLTLATTSSGKWLGLDGLIAYFNPFRKRRPRAASPAAASARAA